MLMPLRVCQSVVLCVCLWVSLSAVGRAQPAAGASTKGLKNPVKATPESVAAGKQLYAKYCSFCHGPDAKGDGPMAPKDTHPPNLTDAVWTHGASDGEIFSTIRDGVGPKFDMKPNKEKIKEPDIWNIVNFLRSVGGKR